MTTATTVPASSTPPAWSTCSASANPDAHHVAELADAALRWAERPDSMPTTLEALGEPSARLGELAELIRVRDAALRHLGRPVPDDASAPD